MRWKEFWRNAADKRGNPLFFLWGNHDTIKRLEVYKNLMAVLIEEETR